MWRALSRTKKWGIWMEILSALESIRTPFLDTLFLYITQLGEEVVFTAVILGSLWCLNKRAGFWMFFSWGCGTGVNQLVKAVCKVPRPWARDAALTTVEAAKPAATGYSFPSGHTQSVLGLFGSLSVFARRRWVTVVSAFLVLLTGFSRLYLGVHTLADVVGAFAIGLAIVFFMAWLSDLEADKPWVTWIACGLLVGISAGWIYALASDSADENMAEAVENGWKLFGASIGLTAAWQLDRYWLRFDTRAVWYVQIVKFAVGVGLALLIQQGLKQPLLDLCGGSHAADGIRYLLIALFAGFLYPLTFRFWAKLGRGKPGTEEQTDKP